MACDKNKGQHSSWDNQLVGTCKQAPASWNTLLQHGKGFLHMEKGFLGFFNEYLVQQMALCCAHKNGSIGYHHCLQMNQEIREAQKSPAQTLGHLCIHHQVHVQLQALEGHRE